MDATTNPRERLIRHILTDGFESGIAYWCNERAAKGRLQVQQALRDAEGLVTGIVFDAAAVEEVSGASLRKGFTQGGQGAASVATVDVAALKRALRGIGAGKVTWGGQPLQAGSTMKKLALQVVLGDPDDVDYDAGDADNLIQAALFGDIVYG